MDNSFEGPGFDRPKFGSFDSDLVMNVAPKIDDRVQLIWIAVEETELTEGDEGLVTEVRFEGGYLQVSVDWDRGETRTLYNGQDRWRVLETQEED